MRKHVFSFCYFLIIFSFFSILFTQKTFANSFLSETLGSVSFGAQNYETYRQPNLQEKISTFGYSVGYFKKLFKPVTDLRIFHTSNQVQTQIKTENKKEVEVKVKKTAQEKDKEIQERRESETTTNTVKNTESTTAAETSSTTKKNITSILEKILQRLGLGNANAATSSNSNVFSQDLNRLNPTQQNLQNQNPQNTTQGSGQQSQQQPQTMGQLFQNPAFQQGVNQGMQQAQGVATQAMNLASPYNGPGGSLPGECGLPVGPIAYNIASESGSGVRCNAKTVIIGYKGRPATKNYFIGGYVTPLVPPFDGANVSKYSGVTGSAGDGYGGRRFANYNSQEARTFIDEQLLHWKSVGAALGQKCVPIDIDNCDNVGSANYKIVLDRVEELNQTAQSSGVLLKVLTKNPQINCNFFSHPAVIGAFIEEISPSDAVRVGQMRNKPEQVLLFAAGSGSKSPNSSANVNLKRLEAIGIKNSAYSYDSGKEYEVVHDCTYIAQ